jgi:hypothetical protein
MATVHVSLRDARTFMVAARTIKQIFHRRGVHATTIQPEILLLEGDPALVPAAAYAVPAEAAAGGADESDGEADDRTCLLSCRTEPGDCSDLGCCTTATAQLMSRRPARGIAHAAYRAVATAAHGSAVDL